MDYTDKPDPIKDAARVCRGGKSDCAGLVYVFASTLRAAKIPARVLIGRWGESSNATESQVHVNAAFFADNVGWVPVNVAYAVSHREIPLLSIFGHNENAFITLHTNTDLVMESAALNPAEHCDGLQKIIVWVRWLNGNGDGNHCDNDWLVTELSASK
jgi:hypothetical protein